MTFSSPGYAARKRVSGVHIWKQKHTPFGRRFRCNVDSIIFQRTYPLSVEAVSLLGSCAGVRSIQRFTCSIYMPIHECVCTYPLWPMASLGEYMHLSRYLMVMTICACCCWQFIVYLVIFKYLQMIYFIFMLLPPLRTHTHRNPRFLRWRAWLHIYKNDVGGCFAIYFVYDFFCTCCLEFKLIDKTVVILVVVIVANVQCATTSIAVELVRFWSRPIINTCLSDSFSVLLCGVFSGRRMAPVQKRLRWMQASI